jgi:hypothetical protein
LGKRSREKMTGLSLKQRIRDAEEKRKRKKEQERKVAAMVLKELLELTVPAIVLKSENTPDDVTFLE